MVSFLIGQKGERIKQIIENSHLIKIDFDNALHSGKASEKVCFLYGNRDSIEEGIDYIEAAIFMHQQVEDESQQIEQLQSQTEDYMQEHGYYEQTKKGPKPENKRGKRRDKNE